MGSLLFFRYHLRETMAVIAFVIAFFAALYFVHNPAVSIIKIEATVTGIAPSLNKVGGANHYKYSLRLDDGSTVLASDYASSPHLDGSRVTIERVTYKSGRIWYRFPSFYSIAEGV